MIALNLISPQQKQELQLRQFYIVIKNLTILFLLLTIIIAIILMASKIILQNNFNEIIASTTLTTRYNNIINKEIESFNKQLETATKIQKNYIAWTNFIIEFIPLVPENVSLYSLNLTRENGQAIISGFARTRDDLLKFKDNLESFNSLSEVNIPLESLFIKENIDFRIEAKINLENLKNLL